MSWSGVGLYFWCYNFCVDKYLLCLVIVMSLVMIAVNSGVVYTVQWLQVIREGRGAGGTFRAKTPTHCVTESWGRAVQFSRREWWWWAVVKWFVSEWDKIGAYATWVGFRLAHYHTLITGWKGWWTLVKNSSAYARNIHFEHWNNDKW